MWGGEGEGYEDLALSSPITFTDNNCGLLVTLLVLLGDLVKEEKDHAGMAQVKSNTVH